jgi:murein DD-endopeptidase MepM/ murein hydrolase activator NlpD
MKEQKGQGTLEYALILALVAIVAIAALSYLGSRLNSIFASIMEVLLNSCESVPESVRDYGDIFPPGAPLGEEDFIWPTTGRITQRAWYCHHAVDIANSEGTEIKAAASGYVVVAGWMSGGYGNTVVINHGNGFQTLYAHLSVINIADRNVHQGDPIGQMGNTGHSTGTHLHFEVRQGSQLHDPLEFVSPP